MTIQEVIHDYTDLFEGQPWHGASILESIQSIDPETAQEKLPNAAHSIAAILKHQIAWREFVIEKLRENKEYDIAINSEEDWAEQPLTQDPGDWDQLVGDLKHSQLEIKKLLRSRKDEWLYTSVVGKNYTNLHMLKGIMYHDIYHLGQIRVLWKMQKAQKMAAAEKLVMQN